MSRTARLMFTPNAEYVWAQDGRFNGEPILAGDPVDASLIVPRRMEALYDLKKIKPAPGFGDASPPRYLENGKGKADKLRAEIKREEAEAAKTSNESTKGEGDAQPRSAAEPAAPRGARAAKPAPALGKKPTERLGSKPAAKSAPKRAAARSR
jgi:hypothetical protein